MANDMNTTMDEAARLTNEAGDELRSTRDDLVGEFRNLIAEGESLLRATSNLSGDALTKAREQFRDKLATARSRATEYSAMARARGREAAVMADDYVHDNPWAAIGVAAGVGFIVGALMTRRP